MQRIHFLVFLALAVAVVLPLRSGAAEIPAGALEFGLSGGFERSDFEDVGLNQLMLHMRMARSITRRIALGGSLDLEYVAEDSGTDANSVGVTGDFILNFPTSGNAVPFGQLSVGVTHWGGDLYDDSELTQILPFLGAGVRVFVGDHASMNALVGYRHQVNVFGVKDVDSNDFVLSLGLSVFPTGVQL